MRNGQAFVGFREAPINFPPTFKYDVLRTIKHKHKGSKRKHAAAQALARLSQGRHTPEAGDEQEHDRRHDGALSELSSDDEAGDIASVVSSGTAFSQRDQVSDEDNDSDAESDYLRRRMSYQQRGGGLVKRFSVSAAQRAKSKLAELISAQSSPRIIRTRRPNTAPQPEGNSKNVRSVPTTPLLGQRVAPPTTDEADDDVLSNSNAPSFVSRGRSTRSLTGDGTVQDDDDKGVYDSSSKQRVPSWCDRILFKSTVKPDPEPEDDAPTAPRTAVSLLAQAWRSFRRTSSASLRSTATAATTISTTSATSSIASSSATMSPTDSEPESSATARPSQQQLQPPPPPPYVPRRRQARPRSIDATALQAASLAPSRPTASPARSASSSTPARSSALHTAAPELHPRAHARFSTDGGGGDGGVHQRWRLLSFLSRDGEATRDVDDAREAATVVAAPFASSPDAATAEAPRPRKGDVVCLSYRTLDDRGMRRLEGRSDHRPVMGVYAIYV